MFFLVGIGIRSKAIFLNGNNFLDGLQNGVNGIQRTPLGKVLQFQEYACPGCCDGTEPACTPNDANCPSDFYFCSGDERWKRDYYCSAYPGCSCEFNDFFVDDCTNYGDGWHCDSGNCVGCQVDPDCPHCWQKCDLIRNECYDFRTQCPDGSTGEGCGLKGKCMYYDYCTGDWCSEDPDYCWNADPTLCRDADSACHKVWQC